MNFAWFVSGSSRRGSRAISMGESGIRRYVTEWPVSGLRTIISLFCTSTLKRGMGQLFMWLRLFYHVASLPHDLPSNLSVRLGNVDDRTRIRRAPESRSVAIGTQQFVWLIRHSIIFRLDQPKHQLDKLRSQLKRQRLAKVSARA